MALDDGAASVHFALGRLYETQSNYSVARLAYLDARDRDQLRFRAPQSFNRIIRAVAAEQEAQVVDIEASFLDHAVDRIIGNELMLEHLHPNLWGYFLLADAYYQALLDDDIPGPEVQVFSREQAWDVLPVTAVDLKKADYEIMRLTADWPFQREPAQPQYPVSDSEIEQLAYSLFTRKTTWSNATEQLQAYYLQQQDTRAAARVGVLLADTYPFDTERQYQSAQLARDAGLDEDAARLLRRASLVSE